MGLRLLPLNGTPQFRSPMVDVLPYIRLENSDHTKSVFDRLVLFVSVPLLLLFFFELYAFIILTSTLVLGIIYFVIMTRPLHALVI